MSAALSHIQRLMHSECEASISGPSIVVSRPGKTEHFNVRLVEARYERHPLELADQMMRDELAMYGFTERPE